jgi:transposase InsO family protein
MRCHANARLSPIGRRLLVDRVQRDGWTVRVAAESAGVSERTAWKWLARWRAEGPAGLVDRCSARHRQASTDAQTVAVICALRRLRFTGPEIAGLLGRPSSTVSAILKREGLGKLGRLGLEPARRYQRDRPGELVHIDIKKLGRIQGGAGKRVRDGLRRHYQPTRTDLEGKRRTTVGWEFVHIAIDDATRLAYAEVLGDEKAVTAVGFLRRAITFYASYGIGTQRVMTDNGSAYVSAAHAIACRALGVRHLRTRPRRPQTNGKAERFIRTMLDGWAYGAVYASSHQRTASLDGWLEHYNHRRPHAALSRQTPVQRLNNLHGSYT